LQGKVLRVVVGGKKLGYELKVGDGDGVGGDDEVV
jgi:hypothetical protein